MDLAARRHRRPATASTIASQPALAPTRPRAACVAHPPLSSVVDAGAQRPGETDVSQAWPAPQSSVIVHWVAHAPVVAHR